MNNYSIVYLGPFEKAPFFGGAFWFDIGVPQSIRGDLAAQLLFTKKTDGSQQFQLASETDFNGMLFDGFIAAGTLSDGLIWAGGSRAVEPSPPPDGASDPSQATAAILGDALPTDETVIAIEETVDGDADANADVPSDSPTAAPRTSRRARNTGAQA